MKTKQMKNKGKKRDERRDYETKSKHTKTERVLCSEDWRDIVITYVPPLNSIPIKDDYTDIYRKKSIGCTNKTKEEHKRRE